MKDFFYRYKFYLKNKECFLVLMILAIFIFLRVPALNTPYHQDEYKWPLYAEGVVYKPGSVPHPPLTEFIYQTTGKLFSLDNFRLTPFLFSVGNFFLLYIFVRRRFDANVALCSVSFFALSFYSILASVMVDTDGAILPFFFLLSLIFYDFFRTGEGGKKWLFGLLTCSAIFLGVLVKLSFVLALGAIAIDYFFEREENINLKKVGLYVAALVGFGLVVVGFLFLAQHLFTGFSLAKGLHYWETFMRGFASRNFFQTGIQFFKALLYSSPFFVLLTLISLFFYQKSLRVFYIFIGLGLIFYIVLFDFSIGALDRYFEFLIVPFCVVSAAFVMSVLKEKNIELKTDHITIGLGVVILIAVTQFLPHAVPPLYPKTEWLARILSLKWNFLYPFSGGSGPIPFYISWIFIALSWLVSLIFASVFVFSPRRRRASIVAMMLVGFGYNLFFAEEYLWGKINGSSKVLVQHTSAFIKDNSAIKKVMVYNDNGGWEIQRMNKYFRRLYAVPDFEPTYESIFKTFRGHILFIETPRLAEDTLYDRFLKTCESIYTETDKYITAKVFDCSLSDF